MEGVRKFNAVVTTDTVAVGGREPIDLALYDADGAPLTVGAQMPVQATSVAADVATLKTDFNALLTKLKNSGLMASS